MACIVTEGLTLAFKLECCLMQFRKDDGRIAFEFYLPEINIFCDASGRLGISQGNTTKVLTEDDAINLGFPSLLLLQNIIESQRDVCCSLEGKEPPIDYEISCVEENDNLYYIDLAAAPPAVFDFNGTDVTGTVTPSKCNKTFKVVTECWSDVIDNSITYTKILCIDSDSNITVFWLDSNDVIVVTPVGIEKCNDDCSIIGSVGIIPDWQVIK